MEGLPPETDDCPIWCSKSEPKIDPYRNQLCEKCPRQLKQNEFKRRTIRLWEEWLDDEAESFDYQDLSAHLSYVLTAKQLPESDRDAGVQRYIDLIAAEESHWKKVRPKDEVSG